MRLHHTEIFYMIVEPLLPIIPSRHHKHRLYTYTPHRYMRYIAGFICKNVYKLHFLRKNTRLIFENPLCPGKALCSFHQYILPFKNCTTRYRFIYCQLTDLHFTGVYTNVYKIKKIRFYTRFTIISHSQILDNLTEFEFTHPLGLNSGSCNKRKS